MKYKNINSGIRYIDISETHKKKEQDTLPVISLFTGAGGLDIGLEESGFQTAVCVEYDADCRETLRYNRPEWKLFEESIKIEKGKKKNRIPGDIRDIEASELLKLAGLKKGEAALVVGGAPCQPFSNIGKKLGKDDEKNGDLFLEFVRIVKGVNPMAFIFENVVGITQEKHTDVINYMIDKFQGLGYGISYSILNSANYGVPQRRERFFLIGIKNKVTPAFPFPTHFKDKTQFENFTNDFKPLNKNYFRKWVTVKDAFQKIPNNANSRIDFAVMNISDTVKRRMTYIEQGENFKVLPLNLRPDCWKSGKHQGNDTFGRIQADLPSCTIRTAAYNPAKGQYIHPFENRGLSTVEMAALQSFPYNWYFRCKGKERVTLVSGGRQIGNAVPPRLARALGLAIREQIQSTKLVSEQKHLELASMS